MGWGGSEGGLFVEEVSSLGARSRVGVVRLIQVQGTTLPYPKQQALSHLPGVPCTPPNLNMISHMAQAGPKLTAILLPQLPKI